MRPLKVMTKLAFARTDSMARFVDPPVLRIAPNLIVAEMVIVWRPPHEHQEVTMVPLVPMIQLHFARLDSRARLALRNVLRIALRPIAAEMAIAWRLPRERGEVTTTPLTPMIELSFAKMGFLTSLAVTAVLRIAPDRKSVV